MPGPGARLRSSLVGANAALGRRAGAGAKATWDFDSRDPTGTDPVSASSHRGSPRRSAPPSPRGLRRGTGGKSLLESRRRPSSYADAAWRCGAPVPRVRPTAPRTTARGQRGGPGGTRAARGRPEAAAKPRLADQPRPPRRSVPSELPLVVGRGARRRLASSGMGGSEGSPQRPPLPISGPAPPRPPRTRNKGLLVPKTEQGSFPAAF